MSAANYPENESERLKQLISYNILDTEKDVRFDRLTFLAKEIARTKWAFISLIDKDRQWFKSSCGLDVVETDRDSAFCAHAILNPSEAFVINDASIDVRFMDNSLVVGEPFIRFYAGIPLVDSQGFALGTLCIIDNEPKKIDISVIQKLRLLAETVTEFIENEKTHMSHTLALSTMKCELLDWDIINDRVCVFGGNDKHFENPRILFGINSFEDLEKNIHPDDKAYVFNLLTQTLKQEIKSFSVDCKLLINHEWKNINLKVQCVYTKKGQAIRLICALTDITQQKTLSNQLEILNEDLKNSHENARDYTYRLANDLQTPANVIRDSLGRLQKLYFQLHGKTTSDEILNFMTTIQSGCIKLENIINASVTLSKIDTVKHFSENICLNELVSCLIDSYDNNIKAKNISVLADKLPNIHYPFDLIETVFDNLISNAIYFSDENKKPQLNIKYQEQDDYHQFCFEDNGIGIDEKYHSKVFEPYKRQKINHSSNGVGFGLPIVSKIITHLNGEIWIESKLGLGTSIYFIIPKNKDEKNISPICLVV